LRIAGAMKSTRLNVKRQFNSGSFMTHLGDKLIYGNVPIEIELVTKAK
jgi:hypothetical protein